MTHRQALLCIAAALATISWPTVADGDPTALSSQASPESEVTSLDALLAPIRDTYGRPALAAAVTRSDGLLAAGAVGVRKAGSDIAVTLEDRFHLGSCTKAMTATMVGRLVERGYIRWQSTLANGLSMIEQSIHEDYRTATLAQLLQHRAGLPDDRKPDMRLLRIRALTGPLPAQRLAIAAMVLEEPPQTPPGDAMQYANAGYTLAGAIAEQALDKTWEALMAEQLFEPLGITSGGFGPPGDTEIVDQPWGHRWAGNRLVPLPPGPLADNPESFGPAGTVHMTISDWARFAALHLRGARGQAKLLRPASFEMLHGDPYDQDYGMGWVLAERPWAEGPTLMHDGSNGANMAVVWLAPNIDLAFLAVTNSGDAGAYPALDAVIGALVKRFVVDAATK